MFGPSKWIGEQVSPDLRARLIEYGLMAALLAVAITWVAGT